MGENYESVSHWGMWPVAEYKVVEYEYTTPETYSPKEVAERYQQLIHKWQHFSYGVPV